MTKVHFVGDVHGFAGSLSILDKPNTIQLGDLNLYGYDNWIMEIGKVSGVVSCKHQFQNKVMFVEGNHEQFPKLNCNADEPYEVVPNLYHIPRGYVSGRTLFLGGGDSIDRDSRKDGISWFKEEKINSVQVDRIFAIRNRIDVVVSHDCPHFALDGIPLPHGRVKMMLPTGLILEDVFRHVKPLLWVFAHYHTSIDLVSNGCRFIGLNTDEEKEIDIPLDDNFFSKE